MLSLEGHIVYYGTPCHIFAKIIRIASVLPVGFSVLWEHFGDLVRRRQENLVIGETQTICRECIWTKKNY